MKKSHITLGAAASILMAVSASARTWTSADGAKTFEADYKSYDAAKEEVTVLRKFKKVKFSLDKLSEADREWLKEKAAEEAAEKAAKEAERSGPSLEDQLAEQAVGKNLNTKTLSRLDGKKFKKAELTKVPEYYILYYSASW